jgi:hypothetical protein
VYVLSASACAAALEKPPPLEWLEPPPLEWPEPEEWLPEKPDEEGICLRRRLWRNRRRWNGLSRCCWNDMSWRRWTRPPLPLPEGRCSTSCRKTAERTAGCSCDAWPRCARRIISVFVRVLRFVVRECVFG